MVSTTTMMTIAISLVITILIPIILFIYFKKKYQISNKVFFIGVLTFFLFAQVLEGAVHAYFLEGNATTKAKIMGNPWIFMLYGGLMAGIFEEAGRYLMMRYALKGHRQWKDGLSFGIGHGGMEVIMIGAISNISLLVYAKMINNQTFESLLINEKVKEALLPIKEQLLETNAYLPLFSGVERAFALVIQMALSILVMYAVREKKLIYLLYAIFIHAFIDFPAALYQTGVFTNIVAIELILGLIAVLSIVWIVKSKRLFNEAEKR